MPFNNSYVIDGELQLKDAGLIAASAAAEVSSVAQILDMGLAFYQGAVILDISAIEFDTANEVYGIFIQGSNSATFASGVVNLGGINLGDAANGANDDTATGRRVLLFNNEINGTLYRYLRLYTVVGGTIVTGINYTAWLSKFFN